MLRVILTIIVPLLLPTVVYVGYVALERRRLASSGGPQPWYVGAPWAWLIGGGLLLMIATLAVLTNFSSGSPGEVYVPAHVRPDGSLVPGHTLPAGKP